MGMMVRECMTSPVVTVTDDTPLDDCMKLLELSLIRRVVVVDDQGACVGIVALADVALCASKRETGDLVREMSKRPVPAFAT
jgi:predicted transcriptional regulator